jgi:group I intron endonuclease
LIIYKAQNKINGKIYIGMTVYSLKRRMAFHLRAKTGIFPAALRKYGRQNFEVESVAWCEDREQLAFLERFYIEFFNSKVPNGYNITDGGNGGMLGVKQSEETRQRHRESARGINIGAKNGMFGKSSWMKGRNHSTAANEKNRKAHMRLWADPAYREKLVASHKGKGHTEVTREKMRRSQKIRRQKERSISA